MARTRSTVTAATVLAVAAVTAVWASVSLAAQQDAPADPVDGFTRAADDRAASEPPPDSATGADSRSTPAPVPRPDQVRLPALGVAAPVVPTGVTPRGDAEIPRDGDLVGWYRFGSRPGDASGSAVLIGHRDTDAEGPGALFELDSVQAGDPVVVGAGARSLRYEVVALRSIDKAALPDALFRRSGPPRLVLITCGGPYLPEAGGYQENVVVVAQPLDSRKAGAER